MTVLIKGMKMPKTCEECALNYDSFACIKTGSRFFRDKDSEFDPFKARLEDCPLVPVPPHGDLIERDAAYDKIAEQEGGNYVDMDAVDMGLSETPVIIPAEEDER